MKPGASSWAKPRHNYIQVKVWKIKEDKETGKQIGEKELYSTETYKAFKGADCRRAFALAFSLALAICAAILGAI